METTPTVHLLSCRGSFEGLVVVPHQPLCPKDKVDLAKVFAVSATFTSSVHIVAEQKVYLTYLFTGDRSTFGPIGTGFKDLPDLKKWKNASIAEAGTTAVSTVVYEDEVHSEDEEMVYQGRLHSLDKTRVKHKSNFMDPTLIEVGNLALLRMNDDEIAVAKIMSIDLDERVIYIHWYGSLPLPNDLRKAQGPLNKLPPAGLSANARSKWKREKYTQTNRDEKAGRGVRALALYFVGFIACRVYIYTYIQNMYTHICTYILTYTQIYAIHTHIHSYKFIYAQIPYTHIYAYIHIYVHI